MLIRQFSEPRGNFATPYLTRTDLAKKSFRSLIGLRQGGLHHHHLAEILDREQANKTAVRLGDPYHRASSLHQGS
jgi:hypothetical protein